MHRDQQENASSLTRALLEHAPTALLATTPEGRILQANQRARALFGDDLHDRWFDDLLAEPERGARAALWASYQADLVPRENVRLRGVLRDRSEVDLRLSLGHVHVDGALILIASMHRDEERVILFDSGQHRRDYRFRNRDGRYRWVRDATRVIYDEDGKPQRLEGCWTDITDLKEAEEAREAAVIRSQALLDAIPDAMVRMNKDGEYLDFKPARGASLMPMPPILGTRLQDRGRSPAMVEHVLGTIRRVVDTGKTEIMEYAIEVEGETVYHEARVCKSGPEETVGIVRDVTERVQSEQRIQELNQRLEQRNRELEATVRELESFSYSVSHELRSPLRAIDGFSQTISEDYDDRLDDEAKNKLGRMRAASQRMGQIIDDLLSLSRIARSSLRREHVDLSAMGADVAEGLRAAFPNHSVALTIAPGLTGVGDRRLLRILMESLLGNAWKYTSHREPARVEIGAVQQDGTPVYFVRDNGAGFDMRYVHKLFGPFQRLHADSEFPGTGIGLATAARIVGLHDGRIWAEGAVGQGATFYFTLAPAGQA